jgi:hypothetical protein
MVRCIRNQKDAQKCGTSGIHVWLVLGKAFRALAAHAEESSNLSRTTLGDAEFRGARSADRLEKKALMKRKNTDDRPVRLLELRAKDRALIAMTFREHAAAMEEAARVLSKEERLMLLRLLKKLGNEGEQGS